MENLLTSFLKVRDEHSDEFSWTWTRFPVEEYVAKNYIEIHKEDVSILMKLAAFYSRLPEVGPILDLGTGANMYPVLAALPKKGIIHCIEPSSASVRYLDHQRKNLSPLWLQYWHLLQKLQPELYTDMDVQESLRKRMWVWQDDYSNLAENHYRLASMFFCAESITKYTWRFEEICKAFVGSVVPGGYFAAAFMENSTGWDVSGQRYPAIAVNADMVREQFSPWSDDAVIEHIPVADTPLRPGYTGMVFVTGTRRN